MKTSNVEKFPNNALVRPLYKKVRSKSKEKTRKDSDFVSINVGRTVKLSGDGISVKRQVVSENNRSDDSNSVLFHLPKTEETKACIPGVCETIHKNKNDNVKRISHLSFNDIEQSATVDVKRTLRGKNGSMEDAVNSRTSSDVVTENKAKSDCSYVDDGVVNIHKVPDTWLRVYPAPSAKNESIASMVFRCIACQMGLATILVLWNLIWVFLIHYFEEPYEAKVSSDFHKEQNQLVIDLATELRQITPISPKWRAAIEARIDEERQLTIHAVGRGARLHPGHFWDLPGTFLFSVYVMTALGFGAPVPQTINGRSAALMYAAIAVPTHIYLMVNFSTCVMVHIDHCVGGIKRRLKEKAPFLVRNSASDCARGTENPDGSSSLRRKTLRMVRIIAIGRCVPLASVAYYAVGAVGFGWTRGRSPLDTALFPLEFTTSGGLENVACITRIMYGLYVEGAMCLLSLGLAALRRQSGAAVTTMSKKYRLFASEKCRECGGGGGK